MCTRPSLWRHDGNLLETANDDSTAAERGGVVDNTEEAAIGLAEKVPFFWRPGFARSAALPCRNAVDASCRRGSPYDHRAEPGLIGRRGTGSPRRLNAASEDEPSINDR